MLTMLLATLAVYFPRKFDAKIKVTGLIVPTTLICLASVNAYMGIDSVTSGCISLSLGSIIEAFISSIKTFIIFFLEDMICKCIRRILVSNKIL